MPTVIGNNDIGNTDNNKNIGANMEEIVKKEQNINVMPVSIVAMLIGVLALTLTGVYFITNNAYSGFNTSLTHTEKNLGDKIENNSKSLDIGIKRVDLKVDVLNMQVNDMKVKMATKDDIARLETKIDKILAKK